MEAVTDPENTDGVLYVAASQMGGKTEVALNTVGYFIDDDPASQIVVTYSLDMASKLSKKRLAGMIRESPALRGKVRDARTRDSNNTIFDKLFDGGDISLVGANSAGGLSSEPKRVLISDEIDRWPASAGTEGDPLAIVLMRLEAYWNAVKVYVTSPGIRNVSRSWRLWEQSDKREWHIDCPHCGVAQVPDWYANVKWEKDEEGNHLPETAAYVCLHCGAAWTELERWKACERGGYVATAEFTGLAGFRISALSIAHVSLEGLVRRWVAAQGNPEEIKVFKNTVLAEWWDEQFVTVDHTGLLSRREKYPEVGGRIAVPAPVALLTSGVDIQDNRFEVSVYGWGAGEESWHIAHAVLFVDPSVPASWTDLGAFIAQPWPREAGGVDYIRGTCVDTGGHYTQSAYDFCAPRFRLPTPDGGRAFVFAIKGSHGTGEVWPRKHSNVTSKVPVWIIRSDVAKDQVYARLSIAQPGPGYMHYSEQVDARFFEQLTAQKKTTRTNRKGFAESYWELKKAGARDETLDCTQYAYAALCGLKAMGFDLEAEVDRLATRPIVEAPAPGAAAPSAPAPTQPPRPARNSWLGDTSDWLRR